MTEMSLKEALEKADVFNKRYENVPSVSRTLTAEVRRLQEQNERLLEFEKQRLLLASEDEIRKEILADGRDPDEYLRASTTSARLACDNALLSHQVNGLRKRLRLAMNFMEEWSNWWSYALGVDDNEPMPPEETAAAEQMAGSLGARARDIVIDNRRALAGILSAPKA